MESNGTLLYVRSLKQSSIVSRQYLLISDPDDVLNALSRGLLAFSMRHGFSWIPNSVLLCHDRTWPLLGYKFTVQNCHEPFSLGS